MLRWRTVYLPARTAPGGAGGPPRAAARGPLRPARRTPPWSRRAPAARRWCAARPSSTAAARSRGGSPALRTCPRPPPRPAPRPGTTAAAAEHMFI
eukprot:5986-Prorocentrum_minimum.AAC.5